MQIYYFFFKLTNIKSFFFRKFALMKLKTLFFALFIILFSACGERQSLEEKALEDVREYNRRYCPTPAVNYIRTDSIAFNPHRHQFTYYCSFCGVLDNEQIIELNKEKITRALQSTVKNSTSMKAYVESGYNFHYVCRSDESPQTILFELSF